MPKLYTPFICFCRIQFYSLWHSVWHHKCGQHKAKKGLWLTTPNKNGPSSVCVLFFCFVLNSIQRFLSLKITYQNASNLKKKSAQWVRKVRSKKCVCVCISTENWPTLPPTRTYTFICIYSINCSRCMCLVRCPNQNHCCCCSFFFSLAPKWMCVSVCVHSLAIWFVIVCRSSFFFILNMKHMQRAKKSLCLHIKVHLHHIRLHEKQHFCV